MYNTYYMLKLQDYSLYNQTLIHDPAQPNDAASFAFILQSFVKDKFLRIFALG